MKSFINSKTQNELKKNYTIRLYKVNMRLWLVTQWICWYFSSRTYLIKQYVDCQYDNDPKYVDIQSQSDIVICSALGTCFTLHLMIDFVKYTGIGSGCHCIFWPVWRSNKIRIWSRYLTGFYYQHICLISRYEE